MDQAEYLKDRVDDQLNWFDRKAGENQKKYKNYKFLILVCSALLPFFAAFEFNFDVAGIKIEKLVVGIIGIFIFIGEGVLMLYKYHDNWVLYRSTAEALKSEKLLFLTKTGNYQAAENPFSDFVKKIELILNKDTQEWKKHIGDDG